MKIDDRSSEVLFCGSGSQEAKSECGNDTVDNLHQHAPWEKMPTAGTSNCGVANASSSIEKQVETASNDNHIEKQIETASNDNQTVVKSDEGSGNSLTGGEDRRTDIRAVALKAPWAHKKGSQDFRRRQGESMSNPNCLSVAEHGKIDNKRTKGSKEQLECEMAVDVSHQHQELERPVANLTAPFKSQGLKEIPPWQRRKNDNLGTQPSKYGTDSNCQSEPSVESGGSCSLGQPESSADKADTVDKSDCRTSPVKHRTTSDPFQKPSASALGTVKRRRSSQMSETSDTSSATSASPHSQAGVSPGSSAGGTQHHKDPERDQEVFAKRKEDLVKELEKILEEPAVNKTEEEKQKLKRVKFQIMMASLDMEINSLLVYEKKEKNRYQVSFYF